MQIDCLTFIRWTTERFLFRENWIIIHFAVFLVHPVRFKAPFKMAIGDYPAEYNPKVHGPYDPARYYGTPDTPFSQLKLGEVTIFFSIVKPYLVTNEHVLCSHVTDLFVLIYYILDSLHLKVVVIGDILYLLIRVTNDQPLFANHAMINIW